MKKRLLLFFILLGHHALSANTPTLVATKIELLQGTPKFENPSFDFKSESTYVLVMENLTDNDLALSFDKFGHSVSTQHLDGVHSVSQTGINIPANQKVTWSFITTHPGEFEYLLNIAGQPYLASSGKFTILKTEQEELAANKKNERKQKQQLEKNQASFTKMKRKLR